ncbi:MAG: RNA 2',3'-cyclic phosphodiesterase, partial [Elusimicrobia bacterium]|nr:RNA 2',3'-cyclic phosphodiesterase [Elusimicrobiota bacterium]
MRLFIAIPIPKSVRAALAEFQNHLAARLPGWRWSKPENLHLTLAFLGETRPEKIPIIEDVMRGPCAEAA